MISLCNYATTKEVVNCTKSFKSNHFFLRQTILQFKITSKNKGPLGKRNFRIDEKKTV